MQSEKQPMSLKKWAILGASVAFIIMTTKSCSKAIDEKWQEEASVYDIKSEVLWGRITILPYTMGLWLGLSDDSLILKPIIALNDRLYESGIAKIPETDGERVRLWDQYKYWPYRGNMEKYSVKIIPEIIRQFTFLTKADSKSPHFREIEQYYIIMHMAYDFFRYRNFSEISMEERNQNMVAITNWLMKKCDNLNMNSFISIRITNGMLGVPLDCYRWSIKYMEYAYKNGMMCDRVSLPIIDQHYKKMQELLQKYYIPRYKGKSQPGILQDIDYMLKHYDENRNKIINTPEHCKE